MSYDGEYEPEVGEWIRVHTAGNGKPRSYLGLCRKVVEDDERGGERWFWIFFPPVVVASKGFDGPSNYIGYESYSLERLSLLEKLAIAADDRYVGGMK